MAVERAAERDEKLRALQDKLTAGVEQLVTGADWKRAVAFAARFRSRSFSNALLIAVQAAEAYEQERIPSPDPSYVAGYRQWQQLGRQVRAGSVGFQIVAPVTARMVSATPEDPGSWHRLRPGDKPSPGEVVRTRMVGVRPATVFPVAMTEGQTPISERPMPQLLRGQAPPGLYDGLVAAIQALGFTVVEVPDAAVIGGANGLTDFAARTVSIRTDMDDAARAKTAGHELGHCCFHDPTDGRSVTHRGIAEVEAESFALLLGAAHGLPTDDYTIPYVASWADSVPGTTPVEVVQATADKVCKTAAQVLARLDTAQVGDGTPQGLQRRGRGIEEVRDRAGRDADHVADAMPPTSTPTPTPTPTPMDPSSTKAGDRFLRDGRVWEAVRVTPAGAGGTSRLDGPTIHATIAREGGSLSDYTADIWSKSITNPASAYTRLELAVGDEPDVSPSTVTHGDALPNAGEAMAVTRQAHHRLDRVQHDGVAQAPGGALRPVPTPGR
jgi:hypothetical protein